MSSAHLHPPTWTLGRRGAGSELQLAGDWIAHLTGLRQAMEARSIVDQAGSGSMRIDCRELGRWDSALVVFLRMVQDRAGAMGVRIDDEGVPQAARQLLALGGRPDATTTVDRKPRRKSLALRDGRAQPERTSSGEIRPVRKVVAVALVAAALSGCAGPAKREYVLGAAGASENALAVQTALPVVQVERVQLPDYLDTRDILTRRDYQIVPSETGRWAERLSVGATRVLATSLGAHLKGVVVTSAQPVDPPVLRVVIDVTAFGSTADGQVVLAARWTVTDGAGQRSLAAEQASFTEPVSGAPDGAVVAAMSLALEKLANRILAGIELNLGQRRRSGLAFVPQPADRAVSCVIEKKET